MRSKSGTMRGKGGTMRSKSSTMRGKGGTMRGKGGTFAVRTSHAAAYDGTEYGGDGAKFILLRPRLAIFR